MAGNHDLFYDGWKEFYSRFGSSTYLFTVKTPDARISLSVWKQEEERWEISSLTG